MPVCTPLRPRLADPVCKELLHTKGNCLPKIKNEKAFTPCGQAAKIIADIVSSTGVQACKGPACGC